MHAAKLVVAAAALLAGTAQAQSTAAPPKPCQGAPYRQFDFWLGQWDVFDQSGKKVGDSRIESFADGCGLLEHWTGASGGNGKSLNMYDASDKQWHQSWVDNSGSRLLLDGQLVDGKMVLANEGPNPAKAGTRLRQQIIWTPNADGSVRQLWQNSVDDGKTWSTAFDGRYVKKHP